MSPVDVPEVDPDALCIAGSRRLMILKTSETIQHSSHLLPAATTRPFPESGLHSFYITNLSSI
jgi:hypothetical protein